MAIHYLIIEKEDEAQTLESVQLLPNHIQRQLAIYDIPHKDLAEIFGQANGTVPIANKENEKKIRHEAKQIVEAFTDPSNFIITYDDLCYEVIVGNTINTDITINDDCTLHVVANDDGYSFDMYSTAELLKENTEDEDDLKEPVASTFVFYSELEGE